MTRCGQCSFPLALSTMYVAGVEIVLEYIW